ncbi:hypothetical protein WJX73_007314 [Symbiochloris irregularis]|uniref:ornithine decarboxylase n=1 Tax=Symbiochloris irregularis TaxID=706552 RepID=A0AAW1NLF6_9CHLO
MDASATSHFGLGPKRGFESTKGADFGNDVPSSADEDHWSIPVGPAVQTDSDVESVDVIRFEELDGRAVFSAGEPPPSAAMTSAVLTSFGATRVASDATPADIATEVIRRQGLEDTFYVFDLSVVSRLYNGWRQVMPSVTPFYAVKCNPDRGMLAMLAALGTGFDCASAAEIDLVLSLGVPAERIIYAHPCKPMSHIRHAAKVGASLTTFDNESELHKLVHAHPGTQLLLRIRADDKLAQHSMGNKYGAEIQETAHLLKAAKALNLAVVGVSFHVGSGASSATAWADAIALARGVFDTGLALGHHMKLLDIGGGFAGGKFLADGSLNLAPVAASVEAALAQHFPPSQGAVRVIAEPGRFFGEQPGALALAINGTRTRETAEGTLRRDYFMSDGIYGSLNCILYDAAKPQARGLRNPLLPPPTPSAKADLCPSTLFGPTCDGADIVASDALLPQLRVGDFIFFAGLSAYSIAGACNFNGFDVAGAKTYYYCSQM